MAAISMANQCNVAAMAIMANNQWYHRIMSIAIISIMA
jgi:hypothetical protein